MHDALSLAAFTIIIAALFGFAMWVEAGMIQ